ncbi:hypothetical protein [Thermomonas sp. HDW16]|uniref:hypothetical protein n=1 Tax=Thermomonas sp. HDW16 TaxID=2714945 RepID=UPI00140BACB3|nr:hypothetical protein [Thermomonas sp. HDW16]QIL21169.1 hypothetical protein G7079_10755 [Thermomonas sp. HDW16]
MNTTTSPGAFATLRSSLGRALQWRLWLLFATASLLCALVAALPAWDWLASLLNHSVQADAIAAGKAPALLLDVLMSRDAPYGVLGENTLTATALMLLLSPLLAGATVAAARSHSRLGFGDLLRGAVSEYGPMLRMLIWSIIPIGIALVVASAIIAGNENAHEHAILASEAATGRNIAFWVGGLLFVLAHASLEAGRGWLAADGRLRSALKAWWRGLKLLCKRPLAVLAVYLGTTIAGLLLAALLLLLRPYLGHGSVLALLLGLLLGSAVAAALAWSRIARLFGMQALAEGMHARR